MVLENSHCWRALNKETETPNRKKFDDDSLLAIHKPKISIALQESDLNLTTEIAIDNNEMFIVIDK